MIHLQSDPELKPRSVVASFRTIREFRLILGVETYHFECSLSHADDQVTVSADLFEELDQIMNCFSEN